MSVKSSAPIASLTRACVSELQSFAPKDSTSEETLAWVRAQLFRLKVFADVLGVFASEKLSLQHRLRLTPTVLNSIRLLLEAILANSKKWLDLEARQHDLDVGVEGDPEDEIDVEPEPLREEHVIGSVQTDNATFGRAKSLRRRTLEQSGHESLETTNERPSSSDDLSDFSGSSETTSGSGILRLISNRIDTDIGNLVSFASLIRSQSILQYEARAEKHKPRDKDGNLLEPAFERSTRRMLDAELNATVQDVPAGIRLKERFLSTIINRWRRICYYNHRADALVDPSVSPQQVDEPSSEPPLKRVKRSGGSEQSQPIVSSISPSVTAKVTLADRTSAKATTLRDEVKLKNRDANTLAPTAPPMSVIGAHVPKFPRPHKTLVQSTGNAYEIQCPLCRIVQVFKKKAGHGFLHEWESHAAQDLAPFICLYDPCPSPDAMFCSLDEWQKHNDTHHAESRWVCNVCTDASHFQDPASFQQHMRNIHEAKISAQEMSFLLSTSLQKTAAYSNCLLCGSDSGEQPPLGLGSTNDTLQGRLRRCMGEHMRNIALLSLPENVAIADDSNASHATASEDTVRTPKGEAMDSGKRLFDNVKVLEIVPRERTSSWLERLFEENNDVRAFVQNQAGDLRAATSHIGTGTTQGRCYQSVRCLLMFWQNDTLGFREDAVRLSDYFAGNFNYKVEVWMIPRDRTDSHMVNQRLERFCERTPIIDELLIIYYGGFVELIPDDPKSLALFPNERQLVAAKWSPNPLQVRLQFDTLFHLDGDMLVILDCDQKNDVFSTLRSNHSPHYNGQKVIVANPFHYKFKAVRGEASFTGNLINAATTFKGAFSVRDLLHRIPANQANQKPGYFDWSMSTNRDILLGSADGHVGNSRNLELVLSFTHITNVIKSNHTNYQYLWLLNSQTYQLENFRNLVPPYAILSHQWGQDEVKYHHVANGESFAQRTGHKKLAATLNAACADGLRYVWIDTVCINRSNQAELATMIDSMWQLYEHAAICYVHLADVSPWQNNDEDRIVDKLRYSSWFTRGWTLQELLAPSKVRFYPDDWSCSANLQQLLYPISEITGIEVRALAKEKPLSEYSVAQKMSWASHRKTTIPEDIAYCLHGLFGITMPLHYGEGEKSAFVRLQMEITNIYGDPTILIWHPQTRNETTRCFAPSPSRFADSHNVCNNLLRSYRPKISLDRGFWSLTTDCMPIETTRHVLAVVGQREEFPDLVEVVRLGRDPEEPQLLKAITWRFVATYSQVSRTQLINRSLLELSDLRSLAIWNDFGWSMTSTKNIELSTRQANEDSDAPHILLPPLLDADHEIRLGTILPSLFGKDSPNPLRPVSAAIWPGYLNAGDVKRRVESSWYYPNDSSYLESATASDSITGVTYIRRGVGKRWASSESHLSSEIRGITCEVMETSWFEPSLDFIGSALAVQPILDLTGSPSLRRPIYMVTGIKVAENGATFSIKSQSSDVRHIRQMGQVVIAYRVMRITIEKRTGPSLRWFKAPSKTATDLLKSADLKPYVPEGEFVVLD